MQEKYLSNFTWVPFYQEMCPKLLEYTPAQLIEFVREVLQIQGIVGLRDFDVDGEPFEMNDIDPYTFLSYLNKFGDLKRLAVLAQLKERMGLSTPVPTDVEGLPSSQAQSVWMFAYKKKRKPDDIDQLKLLYKQVEGRGVTEEQFQRVLGIKQVGKVKLTEALFAQKPTDYFPINRQTEAWLKKRQIPYQFSTFREYISIIEMIKANHKTSFYQISREAYMENNKAAQTATKYYCVGITFEKNVSQLDRFIQEGIWENGYGESKPKYQKIVKEVPVGSFLAAKVTHTRGHKNSISVLLVKAIGKVINNPEDGYSLKVEWFSTEKFSLDDKGSYQDTIGEVTKLDDIQAIFFRNIDRDQDKNNLPILATNYPKNIILYGPPGTGKTYSTIDLAVDIVDGGKDDSHETHKIRFDELRVGNDRQIEFVTFHQNYSYEDFVVGLRPDTNNASTLTFERTYGIFYQIAQRARYNYEQSQAEATVAQQKPFDQVFNEFIRPLTEDDETITIAMKKSKVFTIQDISDNKINLLTDSGSTKNKLSISLLKKYYEGTETPYDQSLGVYYRPLVSFLLERGRLDVSGPIPLKRYVLVIDEINRANMSRVFGELITLIEDDKRLGAPNQLTVTLPNGDPFSVPPNLYIIGTMNTADKSLALLDIALRRRFEFIGIYPNPTILNSNPRAQQLLEALNKAIHKEKRSAEFLIGHAYFLDKAVDVPTALPTIALADVLNKRIIPLLMEYFGGRTDTVQAVLASASVQTALDPFTYQLTVSANGID